MSQATTALVAMHEEFMHIVVHFKSKPSRMFRARHQQIALQIAPIADYIGRETSLICEPAVIEGMGFNLVRVLGQDLKVGLVQRFQLISVSAGC